MKNFVRHAVWPFVIVGGGITLAFLIKAGVDSPFRQIFALCYLLVCPGMAWIYLLRIENGLVRWTLAVALSISFDTLIGLLLLYTEVYSTEYVLLAVLLVSIVGVAVSWFWARPQPAEPHSLVVKSGDSSTNPSTAQPLLFANKTKQSSEQSSSPKLECE